MVEDEEGREREGREVELGRTAGSTRPRSQPCSIFYVLPPHCRLIWPLYHRSLDCRSRTTYDLLREDQKKKEVSEKDDSS